MANSQRRFVNDYYVAGEDSLQLQIMVDSARAKALLDDVNSRREDILRIERNIQELNSLFIEINELVAQQV